MKIKILALLLLALAALPLTAQTEAAIQEALDELVEARFEAGAPGGAVLVARGNHILYQRALGAANLSTGAELRPDMLFRIGSITKQFTAVAILQLVEQGQIALTDTITKFIPDYATQGQTITVEQLLNHTSGIQSYTDMPEWTPEVQAKDFTPAGLVDFFQNQTMQFEPGTKWAYNNSGYILLGYIIEKVSGKSYADYLAAHVFKPAGLTHTFYENQKRPVEGWAEGYQRGDEGFVPAPPLSMTQPYAAGSLVSTVEDLWKWTRAVQAGQLVGKDLLAKAFTPTVLPDGTNTHYGYGWQLGNLRNSPTIEHGGGIHGFQSFLLYLPKEDLTVAALTNCNCGSPEELAARLALTALGQPIAPKPVPLTDRVLVSYAGVYQNEKGEQRFIRFDDGVLSSQRPGGQKYELIPTGPEAFMFEGGLNTALFARDGKTGMVTGLNVSDRRSPENRWTRTNKPLPVERDEQSLDAASLDQYLGEYELMPGFSITVTKSGDKLFGQATGQEKFEMFAESPTLFFLKVVDAQIEFVPEDGGARMAKLYLLQGGQKMEGWRKK